MHIIVDSDNIENNSHALTLRGFLLNQGSFNSLLLRILW